MVEVVILFMIYLMLFDPNKTENVNSKVFIILTRINESKSLVKHMSYDSVYKLDGKKCNSKVKWNKDKSQCKCKKPLKHHVSKNDYIWNASLCACACDEKCETEEYLNNCTCIKHAVANLVITCEDEMVHTTINASHSKNIFFFFLFLLLPLITIVVV